jgi:hypothetical protein
MIGATEEDVKMPKPSVASTACEKPTPMASTKGTVTGPVVTPAESLVQGCGMLVMRSGARKLEGGMGLCDMCALLVYAPSGSWVTLYTLEVASGDKVKCLYGACCRLYTYQLRCNYVWTGERKHSSKSPSPCNVREVFFWENCQDDNDEVLRWHERHETTGFVRRFAWLAFQTRALGSNVSPYRGHNQCVTRHYTDKTTRWPYGLLLRSLHTLLSTDLDQNDVHDWHPKQDLRGSNLHRIPKPAVNASWVNCKSTGVQMDGMTAIERGIYQVFLQIEKEKHWVNIARMLEPNFWLRNPTTLS